MADFHGVHGHHHSHSGSSHSHHSSANHSPSGSRPQSALGNMPRMQSNIGHDDMYAVNYNLALHNAAMASEMHVGPYGQSPSPGPGQSPPTHNDLGNQGLQPRRRPTHIMARQAASPYIRADSVHSSSSEPEDMSLYIGGGDGYGTISMFGEPTDDLHTNGGYEKMTLAPEVTLETLAVSVRAATTTSASDRAKQVFVQAWLTGNYAPYADGNVPRQGLYFSYRRVCDQYGIPHINTATLGKAIRLCFPTIKTRRLGVRGNSKYHYCGIRPATSSEAEWLQDYIRKSNNNAGQGSINATRALEQSDNSSREDDDEDDGGDESEGPSYNPVGGGPKRSLSLGNPRMNPFADEQAEKTPNAAAILSQAQAQAASLREYQKNPRVGVTPFGSHDLPVRNLPNFPNIEDALGGNSTSPQSAAAREVWSWFLEHLDALLDSVRTYRFDQFEMHVRSFWAGLSGPHREVVHAPAIAGLMAKADAILYDEFLEILRSQMLATIPPTAIAGLRQLAVKMEKIILAALDQYGNNFVEPKVELGARFGHLVLRFLDIYQVTQALTAVLTNQKQLADMRRSWQSVDFESVRNQCALVCNCRHEDLVQMLEVDFVTMLNDLTKTNEPVLHIMTWADQCCERLMGGRGPDDRTTMSSRSVLIRWGYVTSQVMRDLTIRSDPSFGAFQIMKLFLDDWISVNVLRSVALSTNSVAASVPAMQQPYAQPSSQPPARHFLALSPMAGQESFNAVETRLPPNSQNTILTPTTTHMLNALQHGAFPNESSNFSGDGYNPLSFMENPEPHSESSVDPSLAFSGFNGASSFDVPTFTPQDLLEPHELPLVKAETAH